MTEQPEQPSVDPTAVYGDLPPQGAPAPPPAPPGEFEGAPVPPPPPPPPPAPSAYGQMPYAAPGAAVDQSRYAGMPQMVPPMPSGPVALPRPRSMDFAVNLMRLGGVVALLDVFTVFLMQSAIRQSVIDGLHKQGKSVDSATVDAGVAAAVIFAIIFGLLGAGLWFWMASANGNGRSWARIVATVFFVISLLSTLGNLTAGSSTVLPTILGLLSVIIGAAAILFMYKRESTDWYRAMSAARNPAR